MRKINMSPIDNILKAIIDQENQRVKKAIKDNNFNKARRLQKELKELLQILK